MPEHHNNIFDTDGYLKNPDLWTEELACSMADQAGISDECPLSPERMDILRYVRDYYRRFEAFPIIRAVCKRVGQDKTCQYDQFPDPVTAWKIAGLPRPTPEVLAKIRIRPQRA